MLNINDKKPLASVITGHFNARSKNWWSQGITNSQGSIIDTLTSTSDNYQLKNLPTHMSNKSSFCLDLIFTPNPNSSQNLVLKNLFMLIVITIIWFLVR